MKKQILLLPVALLLITACSKKEQKSEPVPPSAVTRIVGIGKVTPQGGISDLAAPVSGIVKQLNVQTGDNVKKGDVLLVLDNTDASLALKEADSRLATQKRNIQSAKNTVEQGRVALNEKLRLLNDAHELLAAGATTGENVRELQSDYDQGVLQMKKLQSDLDAKQAQLRELSAQRASSVTELGRTQLTAPMNGTVLDITPRQGEAVTVYQTYARLAPDAPLVVVAEIDELFAGKLALGQACSIVLVGDSIPVAQGEILRISPDLKKKSLFSDSGNDLEDRRVREIEVSLRDIKKPLLIDTKVECTVKLN